MIFSEVLRSHCCSSRLEPNRGGPKIGPDSDQQSAISRSTVPPARLSIARFLSRSGRTGCAYIHHLPKGDGGFESCSLLRRVRLSPEAAFVGREHRLSARVCAAGLATGSVETRRVFGYRANRRQYLCRAIFQYRNAADVVGENATLDLSRPSRNQRGSYRRTRNAMPGEIQSYRDL
jgi:hypothetical protein